LSVLAFIMALSMMAAGCSNDNASAGADGSETSVSIKVIGNEEPDLDGNVGSSTTAATTEAIETVVVTDGEGNAVTGIDGNAITAPAVTTPVNTETLSEEEYLAAMTSETTAPDLIITKTNTERYGYSTLTADEKKLYDDIVHGIEGLKYKICEEDAYSIEEWAKIYGMVYNQEPRLFYMNSKVKVGKLFYTTKSPDAINQMQSAIDATADKLVKEAAGKSSTFEKLKVFHDYLVLNSSFEFSSGSQDYNTSIYNAFGSGEPQGNIQCNGYAKSMQYLCDKAGIVSMVVTGESAEGASHAWNVVDVDGKWYNLDCTWDDPLMDPPLYKNIRYNFFLVPDKWIHNVTHMHVNQHKLSSGKYITYFTPPACTETAQNYFIKNGYVYNDFDSAEAAIKAEIKKAAENKSRSAHIMVGSKTLYDQLYAKGTDYQKYAREFSGVRGISNKACSEEMLIIEFDVLYD
ncbi:MAG: hypothetical protein K2N71_11975, partial [Oscillospiraceae bacterium]|nr:hypothetical protein [Oscillospiraceae bacterium]